MRKVCVSTACWWGLDRNLNRVISTIAKQKIDGVELCFVYLKELLSCKLSRKSIDYLKGLEFNTIHAPMKHHYTNSTRTKNIISKIAKLYDAIDAKFVIIHPWLVKSYKHIDASGMNVCMENGPNKANRGLHYARDLKLLDAHANMNFVLDVGHAATHSFSLTGEFVNALGGKIAYVHVNTTFSKKDEHQPIHLADDKFIKSLVPIKKLKCPIVLEVLYRKNADDYAKDIKFIKKNFL